MTDPQSKDATFSYRAVTPDGQAISGTIDAPDQAEALRRLQTLGLAQIQFSTSAAGPRAKALRGEDFLAFNQQLAQLAGAGLPVEQGLRLIANEMRRDSMRRTLELVTAELEAGKSLPDAVAAYRNKFPPLYAQLIDAGIRAGNLSGILLSLGRHLTLVRRLQAALWQTLTYPAIVVAAFFAVFYFILVALVPRWEPLIVGFRHLRFWIRLNGQYSQQDFAVPTLTAALFDVSHFVCAWPFWSVLLLAAVVLIGAWILLRATNRHEALSERLLLPLPLVGAVLRRNLISRWCYAVALAVEAGMDLPAAIRLADDATASPLLRADGTGLIAAMESGQPLSASPPGKLIPLTVVAAMEVSAARGDLPVTLRAFSQMYQQEAESRLGTIQAVLAPILLVAIGVAVGTVMIAMFLPFLTILNMA
jgi:type IV pilus assembly protein PilC